jgi:putative pyruvate formate lyase activating enzyme
MSGYQPRYIQTHKSGELEAKIEILWSNLACCELCPRKCQVNRLEGELGYCSSGKELMVSSYSPHFGEEAPLVGSGRLVISGIFGISGSGGSGTIFLTNCNLLCYFCQNYEISHGGEGEKVSLERAADMMLYLQNAGCHNINFVSPTHYTPQLVKALKLAIEKGLILPIVWNCGGYENVDIIKLLDGVVDIYMPDFKFSNAEAAKKYCHAPDYFECCKESTKEMHNQVGDLRMDDRGIAQQGLLIRHLVMPNELAGSLEVLRFIAEELSPNSYVNVMSQYRPAGKAFRHKELSRYPTPEEYSQAVEIARNYGLVRGLQNKHLKRF